MIRVGFERGFEPELSEFSFILPFTTGCKSIVQVEIIAIYIDYYDGDSDKWIKMCEQLPLLQKLVFGFRSREVMTRFVQNVVCAKLDALRSADRVKYAVLQGEWPQQFRASDDSEELKGKNRL
ncbi:hypothetical protein PHLCEN_2v11468 [Hermanssonia centrifuga]|uniref:Uncharacterized protein n=1 Tax=Hermanssonia centrifuga TaxID=98765 RepID=A0A2R6NJV4_9APHY|nr:hypothetical protein PHLCEN_2v11468 [Hermanssonia centrifuga]